MKRLLILVAFVPVLLADTCSDQNACDHPPPEIGGVVIDAQASNDPCAGQSVNHVMAWFTRQGNRYPLRCERRDPRGFGYPHIRYDEGGHGDPVNDATFRAELANTLERPTSPTNTHNRGSHGTGRTIGHHDGDRVRAPDGPDGPAGRPRRCRRLTPRGLDDAMAPNRRTFVRHFGGWEEVCPAADWPVGAGRER